MQVCQRYNDGGLRDLCASGSVMPMVVEELDVDVLAVDLALRHGQMKRVVVDLELHLFAALESAAPAMLNATTVFDAGVVLCL